MPSKKVDSSNNVQVEAMSKPDTKIKKPRKAKTGTRTPSSYVLFSMDYRKVISAENPELSLGEVSKKCGEAWSTLDDVSKADWKLKADALKNEKRSAIAAVDTEEPKKKRKPSSYLCFSMMHRKVVLEAEPGLSLADVSRRCGAAWKELSDEQKNEWKVKASQVGG